MNPIICRDSRVTSQWLRPKLLTWDPNIARLTHDPSDSRFSQYNYWWVEFWSPSRLLNQWIITYSERKTQLNSVYERSGELIQGWPANVCLRLQKGQTYGPADMRTGFIPPSTPPSPQINNFSITEVEFSYDQICWVYWDPLDLPNDAEAKVSLFKQEGGIWKKSIFSFNFLSYGELVIIHLLPSSTDVLLTATLFYNQKNWVQDEKLIKIPDAESIPDMRVTNFDLTSRYILLEWNPNDYPQLKVAVRIYIWPHERYPTPLMAKRKTIVDASEGRFYWEHSLPSNTYVTVKAYYIDPNDNSLRGLEDECEDYVP